MSGPTRRPTPAGAPPVAAGTAVLAAAGSAGSRPGKARAPPSRPPRRNSSRLVLPRALMASSGGRLDLGVRDYRCGDYSGGGKAQATGRGAVAETDEGSRGRTSMT